jgi:hypothetical protein
MYTLTIVGITVAVIAVVLFLWSRHQCRDSRGARARFDPLYSAYTKRRRIEGEQARETAGRHRRNERQVWPYPPLESFIYPRLTTGVPIDGDPVDGDPAPALYAPAEPVASHG